MPADRYQRTLLRGHFNAEQDALIERLDAEADPKERAAAAAEEIKRLDALRNAAVAVRDEAIREADGKDIIRSYVDFAERVNLSRARLYQVINADGARQ